MEKVCKDCDRAWGLKSVFLRYFNASGCSEDGLIGEDPVSYTHLDVYKRQTLTGAAAWGLWEASGAVFFSTGAAGAGVTEGCLLYTSRCV